MVVRGMTQEPPPGPDVGTPFTPGDEIKITMSFTHSGNPTAVEVVYVNADDESRTITLSGNPDPAEDSPSTGMDKHSVVVVSAVVDEAHIPGVYRVARTIFYGFSGRAVEIPAEGRLSRPILEGSQHGMMLGEDWPTIQIVPEMPAGKITDVRLVTDED